MGLFLLLAVIHSVMFSCVYAVIFYFIEVNNIKISYVNNLRFRVNKTSFIEDLHLTLTGPGSTT